MSILSNIKKGVANSGSNKGKVLFIKADSKRRIRFLADIEDGMQVVLHDHYDKGINALCQKNIGKKKCPYCGDDEMRTRDAYVWPVWDYDSKEVKLFVGFANNFNPLPALIGMYEAYGTILDRDYVITRSGSSTNTSYSVVPMDKVKFKNSKAKPLAEKKMLDIMAKAYPVDDTEDDQDDDNEPDVDDEDEDEEEEDGGTEDYTEMSPKELYMECVERGLKAKKKQKPKYYIAILEEDDKKNSGDDDWDDDEEDEDGDDW
jgi:hypothetical protein